MHTCDVLDAFLLDDADAQDVVNEDAGATVDGQVGSVLLKAD